MEAQMTAEFESWMVARPALAPPRTRPAKAGSSPLAMSGRITRQSAPSKPARTTLTPVSAACSGGGGREAGQQRGGRRRLQPAPLPQRRQEQQQHPGSEEDAYGDHQREHQED